MVRQRAKAGQTAKSAGGELRSDEDILKERQRTQSFDNADAALRFLSWGCWVLSAAWFLLFSPSVTVVSATTPAALGGLVQELVAALGEPSLILVSLGVFCSNLSKSGPRGAWSSWRRPWHFAWAPALLAGAPAVASVGLIDRSASSVPLPPPACAFVLAVALAAAGFAMLLVIPEGEPDSPQISSVVWGRRLLVLDAYVGLAASASVLFNGLGSFGDPGGLCATWMSAVPMGMCALGTLLCRTDGELVGAVPPVIVHCILVSLSLLLNGELVASLFALAVVIPHAALYLPFPLHEPDSNPFHVAFRRFWRRFVAMMSTKVEGFGDDD